MPNPPETGDPKALPRWAAHRGRPQALPDAHEVSDLQAPRLVGPPELDVSFGDDAAGPSGRESADDEGWWILSY